MALLPNVRLAQPSLRRLGHFFEIGADAIAMTRSGLLRLCIVRAIATLAYWRTLTIPAFGLECPAQHADRSILDCSLILSDPSAKTAEKARAYYVRGQAYVESGQVDTALSDLTNAISLEPDYASAYDVRAAAYVTERKFDLALRDESAAIGLHPDSANYYYNRGNILLQLRESAAAIDDYSTAIRIRPDFALAYMNRGIASGQTGKFAEAVDDLTTAIRLDSNSSDAYFNRGIAYVAANHLDLAAADFGEVVKREPATRAPTAIAAMS
jgi:tetratricopeptide (TPR) repeat protein